MNIIKRMLYLFIIVILVVFIVPFFFNGDAGNSSITGTSTLFTIILMIGVLTFSLLNALKKQKAMLASYKLIISEDSISREMLHTPTITILIKDVQEIIKSKNGALTILGDSKMNAIGVSPAIERKEELETLLSGIKSLTIKTSTSLWQTFQLPIALVGVVLMFTSFYSENLYISSFSGITFLVFMTYSMLILRKSKNVDSKTKRLSYFMIIPMLSVLFSLIMKWMG
ncbi:MAG: hypothetical protein JNM78_06105 [Cyclobacteriaceae bacterium]|nr:hypothetical protein [Cyclobacteriaceae bacterium]